MKTIIKVKTTNFYDFSKLPEIVQNGECIDEWLPARFNDQVLDLADVSYFAKGADDEVLLGSVSPEEFLSTINSWNEEIRRHAIAMVKKWVDNGAPLNDVSSSTEACVAMQEADDEVTTLGYHCVLGTYGELHTVLSDEMLAEMRERPEDYAIVDLYFDYD